MSTEDYLKFILLGDSGVGKTCILNQFLNGNFIERTQLPAGVDIITKEVDVDGELVKMRLWDINCQSDIPEVPDLFCKVNCCALVYDVSHRKSFDSLNKWIKEFVDNATEIIRGEFLFILIGNKTDVSIKKVKYWCGFHNIPYFETSAVDDVNVENTFRSVARILLDPKTIPKTYEVHDKIPGRIRLKETRRCTPCCCSCFW